MTAGGQQTNMFTQQDECLETRYDDTFIDETPQDTVYD